MPEGQNEKKKKRCKSLQMPLVLMAFIYLLPKWIWYMESSWKSKGILGRHNLMTETVILGQGPPLVRRATRCLTEAPTEG